MKFKKIADNLVDKSSIVYQLQELVWQAVREFDKSLKMENIHLEHPENPEHGDYATNVAMVLAKRVGEKPMEIARQITAELKTENLRLKTIEKIEVAKPGFVNFWLSKEWLSKQMERVLKKKDDFGKLDILKNKKIMVEFTDPNPFKEFHIGHLYSNSVGESLAKLFEALGAIVKRANYQGDVGMHVGKAIWGLKKKLENEGLTLKDLEKKSLKKRIYFMGQGYALGAAAFEKDKKAAGEIKGLNYYVYLVGQEYLEKEKNWQPQVDYQQYIKGKKFDLSEIRELYNKGRKWSLDYFETIYKRLGTKFDYYFFESLVGEYGFKMVKEYLNKGVFEKSKGAVIFPGEQYGLHTRVFINSLGLPTYEAKDLGLALAKYKDFPYDQSFNITGNEINEYFKVVLAALKEVGRSLWEKTTHLSHGMVRLPEGKMSSRTGKVLTGEWLLDEVKKRIKKAFPEVNEQRAEVIAVGAVKYALLKSSIGRDVVFDFDKSLSLEGDSGPYLQYTYARAQSVLRKAKAKAIPDRQYLTIRYRNRLTPRVNKEELAILRMIYRFPEVVKEAGENYAPNLICNFLFDLAQKYNTFYNKWSILQPNNKAKASQGSTSLPADATHQALQAGEVARRDSSDGGRLDPELVEGESHDSSEVERTRDFRLSLTAATAQILKSGLNLLGIKTLERM
ncbi:arginine--tRNA ligase [Candidatus Microgenomates bacterium]|nr:arginine--tRNA ligase [Candidatus Microgenomates bacterium]